MPRLTNLALLMAVLVFIGCGSSDDSPSAPNVPSPSDLRATVLSSSSIRLNWADNSPNEAGFRIDRAPTGTSNYSHLPNLAANTETFTDTGLTEGSTYDYRVVAFAGVTLSPSDPLPVSLPLLTPTNLVGQRVSTTSINLTWMDVSNSETGYQVERKVRNVGAFEVVADLNANESAFLSENLSPRTFYQFRVRAVKDTVGSLWSNTVTVETTVQTPVPPSELSAATSSARPNAVSLTWFDNAGNEDGFYVEMSLSEGFGWAPVDTVIADNDRVVVRNLLSETVYFFRVCAYNQFGSSEYSNIVSKEVPGVPNAPSGLTAHAEDWRGVDLRWVDNSGNESSFYIERRIVTNASWNRIFQTEADTTFYYDDNVVANVTYAYRIQSHNDAGESAYSSEVEVTIPDGPPADPVGLNANPIDIDKIILAWNDIANNEDNYFVERRLRNAAEFEQIAALPADANVFTDTGLVPETFYEYRVNCWNLVGTSAYSNVVTVRTHSLTVFYNDFENDLTDAPPPNPWTLQLQGTSYVRVSNRRAANESAKSLLFHDPDVGTNTAFASRTQFNIRNGSMKAMLYIPSESHFGVVGADASANNYITWQLQFNDDATFFVRDGGGLTDPGVSYPIAQWFQLEVAFSTDSSRYQVFFDGAPVTDTVAFQRNDRVANGFVALIAFSDQELYDGYVDEIGYYRYWAGANQTPRPVVPFRPTPVYIGEGPKTAAEALRGPFIPSRK